MKVYQVKRVFEDREVRTVFETQSLRAAVRAMNNVKRAGGKAVVVEAQFKVISE